MKNKAYRPQAVCRKEINKPFGGIRLLGIPTVRDLVVQQALDDILVPIFDPHFHPSSYGYRENRSAENALQVASDYLENTLKLTVNMHKTQLTAMWKGVRYLRVKIHTRYTRIESEKLTSFKDKIKSITRRNTPVNLETVIRDLNPVLRGFGNYFRVCNCKHEFRQLMCWVRHRLGAIQLKLWKKSAKRHRRLRQLGYNGDFPRIKIQPWRNASSQLAHWAMPNSWFKQLGIFDLNSLKIGVLPEITAG